MKKEQLFNLWLKDPNKVEAYMISMPSKKEESIVREYIKEFVGLTGITEIRTGSGKGYRIIGTGLIHDQQKEISNIETIHGIYSGDMNTLKNKIKSFKNSKSFDLLLEIGFSASEIKDIYFSSKTSFIQNVSKKLNENEDKMSLNILINTPNDIMGGLIQYVWGKLVKYPAQVMDIKENENGSINVIVSGEVGKFIGQSGKNIEKMKSLCNKDISVYSLEEAS